MKNVINKLKAPMNRYPHQEFIDKYSLCISQPALRQKIDKYIFINNDIRQPMYVLNSRRHSTPQEGLIDNKISQNLKNNQRAARSKNQKLSESKQNEINESKFLRNRANQFIKKVNQQKNKLKGRFFFLKQQEIERKSIKQQIESLEKTYMKFHYQSKRRNQAYANIKQLAQKAKKRQKTSNSNSHFRQNNFAQNKEKKRKSTIILDKQDDQLKAHKLQNQNKICKTWPDQQGLNNQQYVNDLQQVRKKLILLNKLMKKEDYYKQKQTHFY